MHLVRTRVLVRSTKLFWKDWSLLHVFERVQNSARRRRQVQPAIINQRRLDENARAISCLRHGADKTWGYSPQSPGRGLRPLHPWQVNLTLLPREGLSKRPSAMKLHALPCGHTTGAKTRIKRHRVRVRTGRFKIFKLHLPPGAFNEGMRFEIFARRGHQVTRHSVG